MVRIDYEHTKSKSCINLHLYILIYSKGIEEQAELESFLSLF